MVRRHRAALPAPVQPPGTTPTQDKASASEPAAAAPVDPPEPEGMDPEDMDRLNKELEQLSDEERRATVDAAMDEMLKASEERGVPTRKRTSNDRTPEEEELVQERARQYLASEGIDFTNVNVDVVEVTEAPMGDDPEVKYKTDKTVVVEAYKRGDLQVMEQACNDLLDRKPDDIEVWRMLTTSRLRLNLWDIALQAARRWIGHDPYAVLPRNAEAFALVGCQRYGEARVIFSVLADEIEDQDAAIAGELRECVRRIDELWMTQEPEVCKLSSRPVEVLVGARTPHFFLPNFADSVGPLKVLSTSGEEPGGGQSHARKLIVTKDVEAGGLLFVQNPLVFGVAEKEDHLSRLGDALLAAATASPRAAALVSLLADEGPLEEDNDVIAVIANCDAVRKEGSWSKTPAKLAEQSVICNKIIERSRMFTGRSFTGLWTLPGMARHSCLPTANYVCFGDVMVARAARDLKAGEEVTFSLWDTLVPVEQRRKVSTEVFGFWCRCPRCDAEDAFGPRAEHACNTLQMRMLENAGRLKAIQEQVMIKVEQKNKDFQHKFESRSEAAKYQDGLVGLADRFRNLNGQTITDDDLEKVKEYLPENNEPEMVKVPPDLVDEFLQAIDAFDEGITASGVSEEHQKWLVASHMQYYAEALMLLRLVVDLPTQRRLVARILPAVAAVAPGSFTHMRLSVFNWEVAAQCEDPTLSQAKPGGVLAAREKALALEYLRLRYGKDLTQTELEAAMARVSVSRDIDENWCWDITWCIGTTPKEPKLKTPPKPENRIPSAPQLPQYSI